MNRPLILPAGHDRFAVLALGRRVAAELAAEALDPKAPLAMAAGCTAVALPAKAGAVALSANDARLIALADEYEALDAVVNATHSTAPGYEALIDRYSEIETEMTETSAASLSGVLAKARACQSSTLRHCVEPVSLSVADDVWRLFGGGVA